MSRATHSRGLRAGGACVVRRALLGAVAALLLLAPLASAATGPLELRAVTRLSARLEELRVYSPALGRETRLRVLTPAGVDRSRDRLPVLWLLHGGWGSYRDWTEQGDVEAITAGIDAIVVMPDAGPGGWYSDWRTVETSQGFQRWETYHVRELRPFIEATYGTRTDRAGHGIAGLSMGGFGAIHHAARHPDRFGFAAAFSGAVDNLHPGVVLISFVSPLIMGGKPGDIWGDSILDAPTWRANNPVDLAANLRTVETQLRTGNGQPGGAYPGPLPDPGEAAVAEANASLHRRLDELGIPHVYDEAPGHHAWPYWQDDLRATLPAFVAATARPRPDPVRVDHVAYEPTFSVWGFDVRLDRTGLEPVELSLARHGFRLTGRGTGSVTTPPRYCAGERIDALVWRDGHRARRARLVAQADGRLVVPVELSAEAGPAATVQVILWPARASCPR